MQKRNKILKYGLIGVIGVIVVRLFWVQIIQYDYWTEKAAAQQTLQTTIVADRGEIYMMDGDEPTVVAMNETVWTVIVDPMTADREEVEKLVTEKAGDKVTADWDKAFANKSARYYVVAKNVERDAATAISEADLTGVWLQENTKRVYPEGELASRVLGFVNAEGKGQYGVEGALNEELTGKNGLLKTVKDVNNVALSIGDDNIKVAAEDGKNIVLTIDRTLQYNVEQILAQKMKELGRKNASAIVMDPNTGKVLAMANLPNYDPSDYGNVESANDYVNWALSDAYEPASACKTFSFAAAVNEGKMTASSTYTNTGSVEVDGWTIKNAEQRTSLLGTISMQTALNYSLNTGSIQALRWLGGSNTEITQAGREKLYEYYHDRFGFGSYTGIELSESAGLVTKPNEGYGLDSTYANMTFGQNIQMTMIQAAAAFSSVVNGGKYYTPTMVAGTVDEDGQFVQNEQKEAVRETVSESTSQTMREMLYGTRSKWRANGVDKAGYTIGGKTGTAQVIRDGAYVLDETVATYLGYGGTEGESPSYVIMVRIWEDGKATDGQTHALPVFNALSEYVMDYLRVPPKSD